MAPIPAIAQSKGLRLLYFLNCGFESRRGMKSVSSECCVFSGRDLCVWPISRPERGVSNCDGESSLMRRSWPTSGFGTMEKNPENSYVDKKLFK